MYMYKLIDAYKNPKEKQNYERKTVIKELSKGRIYLHRKGNKELMQRRPA